jgi:hypothetical protein
MGYFSIFLRTNKQNRRLPALNGTSSRDFDRQGSPHLNKAADAGMARLSFF